MAMATWAMLGEGRELLVLLRKALRENTRMKRAERTERWHIRLNAASRDKGGQQRTVAAPTSCSSGLRPSSRIRRLGRRSGCICQDVFARLLAKQWRSTFASRIAGLLLGRHFEIRSC
jgi:hypothetical protein